MLFFSMQDTKICFLNFFFLLSISRWQCFRRLPIFLFNIFVKLFGQCSHHNDCFSGFELSVGRMSSTGKISTFCNITESPLQEKFTKYRFFSFRYHWYVFSYTGSINFVGQKVFTCKNPIMFKFVKQSSQLAPG